MTDHRTTVQVLDAHWPHERVLAMVARRSLWARAGALVGRHEPASVEQELYWPVAIVHATAAGTGRRQWVERVQGAVDLVTGRVGLVDLHLPPAEAVETDPARLITPRLDHEAATAAWHEFFRDHVDRRRKPLRPPALSADRVQTLWLRNTVVAAGSRRLLVDPLVARVEDLRHYPYVQRFLGIPGPGPSSTPKESTPCTA